MSERGEQIFEQALELHDEARAEFIDRECEGNDGLRVEVDSLFDDANAAEHFFDKLQGAVFSPSLSSDDALGPPETELREGEIVGHFRIVSLIGRGGMGTVYRARDTRLERDVALKFLPSYLATGADQARLLEEARAAAALDHPNVCSIHEIGETGDGRLFIAMPCYDGETLKQRIRRGAISVDDAVSIARQIANGLLAAHDRGIIHRDVKPGNIIIMADDSVRLLDFGLAMVVDARLKGGNTPGTIAYMSPEQIRGEPLDQRTDLWSLGVVLYEMLAGSRPFTGRNRRELLHAILHHDVKQISGLKPGIDSHLSSVVTRLLTRDPAKRYQTASAFLSDTSQRRGKSNRLAIPGIAAALVIALAGLTMWQGARAKPGEVPASTQPSLAVLPLANLSADSADGALARGITEELITRLSSSGDIRVMAGTSVAAFKAQGADLRKIADGLGVTSLLEGGLRRVGTAVRIQVRLVNARDGTTRWSHAYDRDFNELLVMQDDIVQAVASELQLRFDRDRQVARHHPRNILAYESYLRGSDPVLMRTQAGMARAGEYFRQAIAIDSTYAAAHAGLAIAYVRLARQAKDPGIQLPKLISLADSEARLALSLDDDLAEAHYALARVREASLDFEGADRSLQRALEIDPNRFVYWRFLATLRSWNERPDEELAVARRVQETDPLTPYGAVAVGAALFRAGRCDEALAQLNPLSVIKPPLMSALFTIAQCYEKKGMTDEAIATLRNGAEAGDPMHMALLGYIEARHGDRSEAKRILADLVARSERVGSGAFQVAMVQTGFGNLNEAFRWLDKSIDDRSITSYIMTPTFEDLHRDPRFGQVKKRLGL